MGLIQEKKKQHFRSIQEMLGANCPKVQDIKRKYRYALRAQEITDRVKKGKSEDFIGDLEDITKIFLCLYDHYLKNNHEKVEMVDFKIPGIGFDYIRTDLIKEKRSILRRSKNKEDEERVYNVLQLNNKNNIYNVRNYTVMVLSLFYVRLVELEGK